MIDMAWRRALEAITAHRPLVDALAPLLEQEALRTDIERVVGEEGSRGGERAPSEQAALGADLETQHTPVSGRPTTAASPLEPLPHMRPHAHPGPE